MILAVLAAFAIGIQVGASPDPPVLGAVKDLIAPDRAQISDERARELIRDEYFREVPADRLVDGSIKGMVEALDDPYSFYFDPRENKEFTQAMSGRYSGVGMAVQRGDKGLAVTAVYEGSPAKKAGIAAGDVITKVDGKSIVGRPADAAVALIKGPEGSSVSLAVRAARNDRGTRLDPPRIIKLTRRAIDIPITDGRIVERAGRRTGVVTLITFAATSGEAVAREIDALAKKRADAFVLDLRGNGGGRLDQAIAIASLFLDDGLVVATDGRARRRRDYNVIKGALITAKPVVVLVDHGSASASEIVAGALKYRDRALVVGARTWGKSTFQEVTEFDNGGALSLTVGRYELPGGKIISKRGLEPDLAAKDDPETRRDEALDAALAALAEFKR